MNWIKITPTDLPKVEVLAYVRKGDKDFYIIGMLVILKGDGVMCTNDDNWGEPTILFPVTHYAILEPPET